MFRVGNVCYVCGFLFVGCKLRCELFCGLGVTRLMSFLFYQVDFCVLSCWVCDFTLFVLGDSFLATCILSRLISMFWDLIAMFNCVLTF